MATVNQFFPVYSSGKKRKTRLVASTSISENLAEWLAKQSHYEKRSVSDILRRALFLERDRIERDCPAGKFDPLYGYDPERQPEEDAEEELRV